MSEFYSTIFNRKNLRLVFAGLFLFVLLAEFGSHVLAHANAPHGHEQIVSVTGDGQDEPCKHVIPCCDNQHSNQQVPNSGHQVFPNDLLEIVQFIPEIEFYTNPPIPLSQADALHRESTPPFHPPQIS